jgi:hypothetical protein
MITFKNSNTEQFYIRWRKYSHQFHLIEFEIRADELISVGGSHHSSVNKCGGREKNDREIKIKRRLEIFLLLSLLSIVIFFH